MSSTHSYFGPAKQMSKTQPACKAGVMAMLQISINALVDGERVRVHTTAGSGVKERRAEKKTKKKKKHAAEDC